MHSLQVKKVPAEFESWIFPGIQGTYFLIRVLQSNILPLKEVKIFAKSF